MRTGRLGLAVILLGVPAASPSAFSEATADKYVQAQKSPPPPAAAAVKNVTVTVNYTGKGPVDAGHGVLVFLFSDPNIGAQSQSLGPPQVVQKNGGSVTFKDVAASPVYIAAVYNDKGTYDGNTPPPPGTPWAVYAKDVKDPKSPALPVTPGPKTTVKLSFSDARKFGG